MDEERTRKVYISDNTIVDRGGYVSSGIRINQQLVRPPEASESSHNLVAKPEKETPPVLPAQS